MNSKIFYIPLLCLLLACMNGSGNGQDGEDSNSPGAKKNISKRDYSITKANSYSDLFFDSTAMENFIAVQKVPDSLGNRLRSFYNTRNYQYAWFTRQGFTEQARAFWNLFDHYLTVSNDTALASKSLEKHMNRLLAEESFTVGQ